MQRRFSLRERAGRASLAASPRKLPGLDPERALAKDAIGGSRRRNEALARGQEPAANRKTSKGNRRRLSISTSSSSSLARSFSFLLEELLPRVRSHAIFVLESAEATRKKKKARAGETELEEERVRETCDRPRRRRLALSNQERERARFPGLPQLCFFPLLPYLPRALQLLDPLTGSRAYFTMVRGRKGKEKKRCFSERRVVKRERERAAAAFDFFLFERERELEH